MNNLSSSEYTIEHNIAEARFEALLPNDEIAVVKYKLDKSNNTVDFFSTQVPISQRGKGLAALITDASLAWANDNKLNIEASCWYVAKKLEKSD